ncbi:MAG: biotin carboxylase N-terminal domain-containing protein [Halobacteria archaeon]
MESKPIRSLLVANRGEIARRVIRTARRLSIRTVALHSDVDAKALHVKEADAAVPLGGNAPGETYLDIEKVVAAAKKAGAEAIHPGYGFLSERPTFARRCREESILFVGPSPEAMEALGDKERAREVARRVGAPLAPGTPILPGPDEAAREAERVGYPVLLKASAGGGGIGTKRVDSPADIAKAFDEASRRAQQAFGDGRLYLEKYLRDPHHIEVQVLGDRAGKVVTFVERECSVQRRFQKVIEESPSPFATPALRQRLREAARAVAKVAKYENAGTVEFVVDGDRNPYFLEVNTRLQVEHPVTEMVTEIVRGAQPKASTAGRTAAEGGRKSNRLDLVEQQLRIAAGELLALDEARLPVSGHAIQCRVYAEDPERFFPSPGPLATYREPSGEGVRVDSGYTQGDALTPHYDPLIAKLIVHGPDRETAISRMAGALERYEIGGLKHNIPFLKNAVGSDLFRGGNYTTHFIEALRAAAMRK